VTSAGPSADDGAGALAAFLGELTGSFRRLRPQGTLRWNFSDAWVRLERSLARLRENLDEPAAGPGAGAAGGDSGRTGRARATAVAAVERARAARRALLEPDRPPAADDARWRELTESLDAALEAFRYLTARVEVLEDEAERRRRPIDGLDWLVAPPVLGEWVGPVSERLASAADGPVLHAECGAGELALGLSGARPVEGVEPRSTIAWTATERGLRVHPRPVQDHLAGLRPAGLGALVLSGVVDRLAPDELLGLVDLATGRLAHGGALVVIGTDPSAPRLVGPAADDLLPGRPLHAETWLLLLERAGYADVGPLGPPTPTAGSTFAVGGLRP
jgi:hypothetical protein